MIKTAIIGAAGRMGCNLIQAIQQNPNTILSAAIEHTQSKALGQDAGQVAGLEVLNIPITSALEKTQFEVCIDFTAPQVTLNTLSYCLEKQLPIVIGTTGFTEAQKQQITEAAQHIPIVFAPNMSIGVNLTFKLVELATRILQDQVDIEIIEAHHRHKVDAPSGTALKLGEIIAQVLERDLSKDAIYGRQGHTGARDTKTIGFSTIRAGDIVGEHTVMFAGLGERVEITHKAASRMTFASGAVTAAVWLVKQPPGLYDMQTVLGLNTF